LSKKSFIYLSIILLVSLLSVQVYFGYYEGEKSNITITENKGPVKIPKKDRIDLAMRHEYDMTHDPGLKYIPKLRLQQAREFRDTKLEKQSKSKSKIAGVTWTERGPDNVGGRTRVAVWDPNDPSNTKVWAGSVTGGLWYNDDVTDASSEWQAVGDDWNNIAISAMAIDPNDTDIMYVGTGEGHIIGSTRGEGMFKTVDGGTTWTQMTAANGFYDTDDNFHYVNDIIVKDESGTSVLYVATQESLNSYSYFSYAASGDRGLWRSDDGGVTFTQVLPDVTGESYPYAVADIELSASGRIYVGTTQDFNGSVGGYYNGGGNILYSDDGTNWTIAYNPGSGDRVELACAPSDAETVYAMAADGNNVGWMVKTTNGDQASPSWSSLTIPRYVAQSCSNSSNDFTRGQAWYDLIMEVHPADESTLIIGGIDLYRSDDGGSSFDLISYWTGGCDNYVHADQHMITFNPNNDDEVIFGNDGGVYYCADITASNPSISARNNGYNVTQFYGTAIHPTAGTDHFLAGAQDNGSQRFTSSGMNSTTEVSGGDGAYCNIDQDEPTYQWTQYVYNNFYRSTNGGTSFSSVSEFGSSSGRFINPSRYDDTNNIMYAAAGTNEILRWSNPQSGSTGTFASVSIGGGQISAITVSPNTSNRIFVGTGASVGGGTPGGDVYVIDDAHSGSSLTATDISSSSFPANGYVSCIEVENGDDNHILVTFSNYGVSSIWETTDGGSNWTEVEGDLPDMPVRWALFHPLDNSAAIIATELGVWTTSSLNGSSTTWGPSDDMPNVRTDMLQYRTSDNEVIAATHGRGLFSSSSFAASPSADPEISFTSSSQSQEESSTTAAESGDCRPYEDYSITMNIANAPTGDATVTLSLGAGTTATEWNDFAFTTNGDFSLGSKSNILTFADGATVDQTVELRIYDDAAVESSEVIELEFAISGTTDAIKASSKTTYTFTITDNDEAPTFAGDVTLLSEDFEGGATPAGWAIAEIITSTNDWRIDTENAINGTYSAHVSSSSASGNYSASDDAQALFITPQIDATSYSDMTFSFNYVCNGEVFSGTPYDYGLLAYSLDGSSFSQLGSDIFQGVTSTTAYSTTLPEELEGETFYLAFYWTNDGSVSNDPAFVVDDVSLTAAGTDIATTLSQSTEQYLGPNETVMFYDDGTGELIAKIENTSSHDYGCTTITIDRSGTGTSEFWSASSNEYLMDKTIYVEPANNWNSGTYDITVYYSQTEVGNWESATGKSASDLKLAKVSSPISMINSSASGSYNPELGTSNSASAFGDGYAIKSSFTTGFSGIGAGDPGDPPAALPVTLISFEAECEDEDVQLTWSSATEINTDYFEIQHSLDGENFETIGIEKAAGNSDKQIDYDFLHEDVGYGMHYYQLKMVDLDDTYEYSEKAKAFQNNSGFEFVSAYPNPTSEYLTVSYNGDNNASTEVSLINTWGVSVYQQSMRPNVGSNSLKLDVTNINAGVYLLTIKNSDRLITRRVVIQ